MRPTERPTRRTGLGPQSEQTSDRPPAQQNTFRTGPPRVQVDKALALAAALEDEARVRLFGLVVTETKHE